VTVPAEAERVALLAAAVHAAEQAAPGRRSPVARAEGGWKMTGRRAGLAGS
jgi:hypothetical protein